MNPATLEEYNIKIIQYNEVSFFFSFNVSCDIVPNLL